MRVIAGSARGRTLSVPAGDRVRPTADRVKEALFSSLTSRFGTIEDLAVLDLFAGSGNLGIEALSRGAGSAVFVDNNPESLQFIRKNLQLAGLSDRAQVIRADAVTAARELASKHMKFDIVFADPPYGAIAISKELVAAVTNGKLVREEGVMVIESARKVDLALPAGIALSARKVYGDTALNFLEFPKP